MKKKKKPTERDPDLKSGENEKEIEARVDEMLELSKAEREQKTPAKVSEPESAAGPADETVSGPPALPESVEKKKTPITVLHHDETSQPEPEPAPPKTKKTSISVQDASEEPAEETAPVESTEPPEDIPETEDTETKDDAPDTADQPDEETAEEPVSSTQVTEAAEPKAPSEDEKAEPVPPEEPEPLASEEPSKEDLAAAIEQVNARLRKNAVSSEDEEVAEEPQEQKQPEPKESEARPIVMPGMVNNLAHLQPPKPTETDPTSEDPQMVKAIEDIVAKESDELLAAEDALAEQAFAPPPKPKKFARLRKLLASKKARIAIAALVLFAIVVAAAVPASRYAVLNTVGVRSSMSLNVIDQSSLQPLRGVNITVADQTVATDKNGQVSFDNLRLGNYSMNIEKRAFAPVIRDVTVGWGSNPLGEQRLSPTGSQYTILVTDFLSGNPVKGVEATSGEYSALSDEEGKILLTVDEPETESLPLNITGDTYRTEQIELVLDDQSERQLQLVAGRRHLFVSKRTGTYDLYSIDADGKNEALLLPGTGSEREDMSILSHPTKEYAAYVSTRDNKRNQDGFLLSTLTAVDVANKTNKTIVTSERVQLIDWIDNRIVYVRVAEGASTVNPQRHKLMSYNVETGETTELAASNYFNDVMIAQDKVYYAPASAYTPAERVGLFVIDADGNNQKSVINKEIWGLFRLASGNLTLSAQQEWFEYNLDGTKAPASISEPASLASRAYVDNPAHSHSLWVDNRDGKGVLLSYEYENNEDKIIRTDSGLRLPVRWLNDSTLVYRVVTGEETADYVMNIEGGEPRKIVDVTNTNSSDSWYYY